MSNDGRDGLAYSSCLGNGAVEFGQAVVDAGSHVEVYTSFVAHQSGLHVVQVVGSCFLVAGIVTLQLELHGFEEVARVVLVRDGERCDVHLHEAVDDVAFAANGQHLEHTVLCAVVRILGAAFALGNPDGLLLLANGVSACSAICVLTTPASGAWAIHVVR